MAAVNNHARPERAIRLRLLGTPSVEMDGQTTVAFRSTRIPALLGLLASRPGPLRRDFVAACLWPDHMPEEGRHNLRQLLLYIKQQFGDDFVVGERNVVSLSPTIETDVDVVRKASEPFQSFANSVRSAKEAVEAYTGEFLEGFDDEWIPAVRTQLSKAYVEAILLYSDCTVKINPKQALDLANIAIAVEPFLDGARVRKIKALMSMGEESSAHKEVAAYKRFLAIELGIEPSSMVLEALETTKKPIIQTPIQEKQNHIEGENAIAVMLNSNRPIRGLDLAVSFVPFWASQNLADEGIAILEKALEANQGNPLSDSFLQANVAHAELLVASGQAFEAKEILAKSLPLLTNPISRIRALNLYARIFTISFRPQEGKEYIAQAVSLARELGAKEEQIDALRYAAEITFQLEDLAAAEEYAKECLKLCKEIGDWDSQASIRAQIAVFQERSGNPAESRKTIHLGIRELAGKVAYRATFTRARFARLLEEIGDVAEAESGYRQCIVEGRQFADHHGLAISLTYLGDILTTHGRFEEALECHQEALKIRRRIFEQLGEATSLRGIGRIYLATNRLDEAQKALRESSRLFLICGIVPGHASVLVELSRIAKAKGDTGLALRIATQARHLMMGMSKLSLQTIGPRSMNLLQQTEELLRELSD